MADNDYIVTAGLEGAFQALRSRDPSKVSERIVEQHPDYKRIPKHKKDSIERMRVELIPDINIAKIVTVAPSAYILISLFNEELTALREIAEKNIIYNKETKTLTIKYGKMKGTYLNINKSSAIEIAKSN